MASTTPQYVTQDREGGESSLQELAKKHLWMHFTRMSAYDDAEVPILVRGEGCYVYDEHGKRYLDGLAALFCVNAGHGRAEIGEAMAEQVKELGFFTNWSYAHPPAIELAARIAGLAPDGMERVFFTSGGSEAVESAMKMCRAWHRMNGDGQRIKVIAREIAYHGTTHGRAVRHRHHRPAQAVRAAHPGRLPRAEHQQLPLARGPRPAVAGGRAGGADRVRGPRDRVRRDHGAGAERRRRVRAARGLLAAGPRDLRQVRRPADLRRGDLLVGPARRVLRLRALRLPARPDHHREGPDLRLRADGRGDRLTTRWPSRS